MDYKNSLSKLTPTELKEKLEKQQQKYKSLKEQTSILRSGSHSISNYGAYREYHKHLDEIDACVEKIEILTACLRKLQAPPQTPGKHT